MADEQIEDVPKCPECEPGLPGWMATFSDLVTLLLTFFVLLLSFAKTESSKYEAALGSIRKAFGGNVLKHGEVIQLGKSADDRPTMMEGQDMVRPFPIEFLTTEGLLDKHEVNRESTENLNQMRNNLDQYELKEQVDIYEVKEGIKVLVKNKIYFNQGNYKIKEISVEVFQKVINMMSKENWKIFVMGHAAKGERSKNGKLDSFQLSAKRASFVTNSLIRRGVSPGKITTVFYGDTRPLKLSGQSSSKLERRVEFILRKVDLHESGHKVSTQ